MSYIPSLTLPSNLFASPYASLALPLTLGIGSGLISQPGSSAPKSTADGPSPDRKTYFSNESTKKKYTGLKQPPFRPPPYLFAPAWTILYGLMGYASHRAWTKGMSTLNPRTVENTRIGATLYTVQLGLNLCFMPLFFGLGRPVEALVDITALTGIVGYLTYVWSKVDKTASYCLVPYLGWLGFATYLTAGTGYLNGWDFGKKFEAVEKTE
jgi:benzodiazapine receptor